MKLPQFGRSHQIHPISSPTPRTHRQNERSRLKSTGGTGVFAQHCAQISQKTMGQGQSARKTSSSARSPDYDKKLPDRKVSRLDAFFSWLDRAVIRAKIRWYSMRLEAGFYRSPDSRSRLKELKSAAERELNGLEHEKKKNQCMKKAQEDFEDGQYSAAAHNLVRGCSHAVQEGRNKVLRLFNDNE